MLPNIWVAIAMIIVSTAITMALTPKTKPPDPESLDDFDFPQTDEGTPQAVIFGDCWSSDWCVLSVGNYRTTPIEVDDGSKK